MTNCKKCGKETTNPKFCSQSCAASYNNKGVRRHGKTVTSRCNNCGNLCKRNASRFCSIACSNEYKHNTYIESWLSGNVDGMRGGYGLSQHIRKFLLEKVGHSCSKCGWNEVHPLTGNVPLQVNHIDGNWKNNRPENLEVLCPNCHSLTENFGSLNVDGRYINGKPNPMKKRQGVGAATRKG